MARHGLLIVWGDVEPLPVRWYSSARRRDLAAFRYREKEGDEHGLYRVQLSDSYPASLTICAFSGGQMTDGVNAIRAARREREAVTVADEARAPSEISPYAHPSGMGLLRQPNPAAG